MLAKEFIDEKKRAGVGNFADEMATTFDWFIMFIGKDRHPGTITRDDINEYRDALLTLPAFWESRCKGMTIREASLYGKANPEVAKMALAAVKGKRLEPIKRLFEWMVDRRVIEPLDLNKITIEVPKSIRRRRKRDAFTPEQLNAMFAAPAYQEAANAGLPIREARLWLPLVGLFTGARRGELCQLRLTDFVTRDGVTCFDINELPDPEEEPELAKQLKNDGSIRIVPVHPMLFRLGLLAYVEHRRAAGGTLLFPVSPGAQRPADAFGKWFHRFITEAGTKTKRTCFHSFRHNFEQAMLATVKDFTVRCALGGRTMEHSSNEYHEGAVPAPRLQEEIAKVRYPDVKLDHLCPRPILVKGTALG